MGFLLCAFLLLVSGGCPAQSFPSRNWRKADSLLQTCFDAYGVADSSQYLHAWYHVPDPAPVVKNATTAMDLFTAELRHLDVAHQFQTIRKVAWCSHFQSTNFSYQESLPSSRGIALAEMEVCIALIPTPPPTLELAGLYENAAQMAIPHFYFGYQSPTSVQAEAEAYAYLDKAVEVYVELNQPAEALRCLRLIHRDDLPFLLQKLALGRKVEPEGTLALVDDILAVYDRVQYQPVAEADRAGIQDAGAFALALLRTMPDSPEAQSRLRTLLGRMGYIAMKRLDNPTLALDCYLQAQAAEERLGMQLYYNAFNIAALYIALGKPREADAQYAKALTGPPLSVTDAEHAYFGRAMVAWREGRLADAKEIWKAHIPDKEIMNGVSEYPSRFPKSIQAEIRRDALAMVQSVGASNAQRIVLENWPAQQ